MTRMFERALGLAYFLALLAGAVWLFGPFEARAQTYGQVQWGFQQGTTTPNIVIFDGTQSIPVFSLNTVTHVATLTSSISALIVPSLTTNNIISTEFPGLSNSVESTGYPGLDMNPCTTLATCTWFIFSKPTNQTGALQSAFYVQRNTQGLTGTCPSCGTANTVPGAIFVQNFSGRNDICWNVGVTTQLFNQSLGTGASQDAAGLFYSTKQNSTGGGEVGFTWGLNAYCYDQQPTVNPIYSCIGAEIDVFTVAAAGADTNAARVALTITGGVTPGTDAAVHIGTAIQIGTIGGATVDRGLSYFAGIYGTLITTRGGTVAAATGIDFSLATFSSGNGFLLPTGTNICLNAAANCFKWDGTSINFAANPIKIASFTATNLLGNTTAPTVTGFCTSPSVVANNGTWAFTINVGTACAVSTGTITLPTASNGWVCTAHDVTTPASNIVEQSSGTTTTVVLQNYVRTTGVAGNFTSSDVLRVNCAAF